MKFKIINFLAFQTGWFLTCFGAANALPYIGPLFTLTWLVAHLVFIDEHWRKDALIVSLAAVIGYAFDSVLVLLGVLEFPYTAQLGQPTTLWMVTLWINLALVVRHSLGWLRNKVILAGFLGAVSGPLAYFAGHRIGCLVITEPLSLSMIVIAIEWLIALPLLMCAVKTLELNENELFIARSLHRQKTEV